jgi:hypothetical protein
MIRCRQILLLSRVFRSCRWVYRANRQPQTGGYMVRCPRWADQALRSASGPKTAGQSWPRCSPGRSAEPEPEPGCQHPARHHRRGGWPGQPGTAGPDPRERRCSSAGPDRGPWRWSSPRSLPWCGELTFRTPTRHRAPNQQPERILIPGDGAAGGQEAQNRPACPAMAATRHLRPVPSQRLPGAMVSGAPAVLNRQVTSTPIHMARPGPASVPRGHAPL